MQTASRLLWIDTMKTIGMWTIICYHFFAPITACHLSVVGVPLFFILSGYLTHTECDWPTFWQKSIRTLVIPYALLCLLRMVVNIWILPDFRSLHDILISLGGIATGFNKYCNIPGNCELWFVYTLLIIKICFQWTQSKTWRILTLAVFAFFYAYFAPKYLIFDPSTFWGVLGFGQGTLFFLIGFAIKLIHERLITKERWWHIVILSVVCAIIFWKCGDWNGYTGIGIGYYGSNLLLCIVGGVCGTITIYGICKGIEAIQHKAGGHNHITQLHSTGSIIVLALHIPVLWICLRYPLFTNHEINACVYSIIIQIIFTPILFIIHKYIPILEGRRG